MKSTYCQGSVGGCYLSTAYRNLGIRIIIFLYLGVVTLGMRLLKRNCMKTRVSSFHRTRESTEYKFNIYYISLGYPLPKHIGFELLATAQPR